MDGSTYEGNWKNDKFEGDSNTMKFIYHNAAKYSYRESSEISVNNSIYIGNTENSLANGKGVITIRSKIEPSKGTLRFHS